MSRSDLVELPEPFDVVKKGETIVHLIPRASLFVGEGMILRVQTVNYSTYLNQPSRVLT